MSKLTPKQLEQQAADIGLKLNPLDYKAIELGYYLDVSKAKQVVNFCHNYLTYHADDGTAKPFAFLDWQYKDLILPMAWRKPSGEKRWKDIAIWTPKKNGKSLVISTFSAFFLVAAGWHNNLVVVAAATREQASRIYEDVEKMIAGGDLCKILKLRQYQKRIDYAKTNSRLQVISSENAGSEGLRWNVLLLDEIHVCSDKLWESLKYGSRGKKDPLKITISTAGDSQRGFAYERWEQTQRVLNGKEEDLEFLGVCYKADPSDDYRDPKVWAKANPSLGTVLSIEDFAKDALNVEANPYALPGFLQRSLNVWSTGNHGAWINKGWWINCGKKTVSDTELAGKKCFVGIDLSIKHDISSMVAAFPLANGEWAVRTKHYLPADGIEKKEQEDEAHYVKWAKQGYLTLCPGNVIDYQYLIDDLTKWAKQYEVLQLGLDKAHAVQLAIQLDKTGYECVMVPQGFALSEPCGYLEALLIESKLLHCNDPVLTYMSENVCLATDRGERRFPVKQNKNSKRRIDGISAMLSALALGTCGKYAVATTSNELQNSLEVEGIMKQYEMMQTLYAK